VKSPPGRKAAKAHWRNFMIGKGKPGALVGATGAVSRLFRSDIDHLVQKSSSQQSAGSEGKLCCAAPNTAQSSSRVGAIA
jgi:hypothetical protein